MDSEVYWRAVTANDARFDGAFFVGVLTTGIYCRPSCRARTPKRENVRFFATWNDAEKSGLRACMRCKPKDGTHEDPLVAKVLKACELLASEHGYDLDSLAAEIGLSRYHLQRSFKEIIGVTPKKYAEAIRMEKFREAVRSGSAIVVWM